MKYTNFLLCAGKTLTASALAAALLCSCAGTAASGTAQNSAPENSGSPAAAAPVYNLSELGDGGTLRILSGNEFSRDALVFCGKTQLYRAGAHESVQLLQDCITGETPYYAVTSPLGSDRTRLQVYDEDGAEVYSVEDEAVLGLVNGWLLLCTGDQNEATGLSLTPTESRFVNTATGEEKPGPQNASYLVGEGGSYFFLNMLTLTDADTYTTQSDTILYDKDLNEVKRFEHCYAASASVPYDISSAPTHWASVNPEDYMSTDTVYYNLADACAYENLLSLCGSGVACYAEPDGGYTVRALDDPDTVLLHSERPCYAYWNGMAIYVSDDNSDTLFDDGEGLRTILSSSICGDSLTVQLEDGTLAFYGPGGLLGEVTGLSPDGWIEALPGDRCLVSTYQNDIFQGRIYSPDGLVLDMQSLGYTGVYCSSKPDGLLFATRPAPATQYSLLYDVLDADGNVLLSDLGTAYSCDIDFAIYARRGFYYGWMNLSGQWIYCESIFNGMDDSSFAWF